MVMWNLQTLDGCFEGAKPWALDFHLSAWGEELERFAIAQLDDLGAILFGRATYEGMAAHWTRATGAIADRVNALQKVVFSSTLASADWRNTRLLRGDPAAAVATLKREAGKDLFVFGSARLCDALWRAGLFDEVRVCLAPVVLGGGVRSAPHARE
jgi:dihydrofolate reductase